MEKIEKYINVYNKSKKIISKIDSEIKNLQDQIAELTNQRDIVEKQLEESCSKAFQEGLITSQSWTYTDDFERQVINAQPKRER